MSWILAAVGFMVLIVLHELGHFAVAKAVGMRVERFALFFPPLIWRRQGRGETEYALGAIPLGGYVKISGMNPHEELPPEVEHRAYYRQPVWKRVVVILAGPVVNIFIAFAIFAVLILNNGLPTDGAIVKAVEPNQPATGLLQPGDRIVSVDGRTGDVDDLQRQLVTHTCEGPLRPGCMAAEPATLVLVRDGRRVTVRARPIYDGRLKRMRLGFLQDRVFEDAGLGEALVGSVEQMASFTAATVTTIAQIFRAEKRDEISGLVGSYEVTRQAVSLDFETAMMVLALISLSLGVINLFPFLPLDGGHIFWAVAEKVRGQAIPFSVMERAGFVGFALVLMLFVIGLSNDITRLTGEGFDLTR